jgi:hypothetical protein
MTADWLAGAGTGVPRFRQLEGTMNTTSHLAVDAIRRRPYVTGLH